eukprot:TRINITY_DN2366_c0_g1_i5.p1 TRINITY_DN2366_c0_g1~~TRINITY_DN2366_c0_g1_i5.p1  ORF type:complete len:221 (+),score=18.52 TRINITY_DN2366_c0_g1_i5:306-968(+)
MVVDKELHHPAGEQQQLYNKAGSKVEEELKTIRANTPSIEYGQVVATSGGDLLTRNLLHCVLPVWTGQANEDETRLGEAIQNCLRIAKEKSYRDISFSFIGNEKLGYPLKTISKIIATQSVMWSNAEKIGRFPLEIRLIGDDLSKALMFKEDLEKILVLSKDAQKQRILYGIIAKLTFLSNISNTLTFLLRPGHYVPPSCLLYTSPSPRDGLLSRMPSSA